MLHAGYLKLLAVVGALLLSVSLSGCISVEPDPLDFTKTVTERSPTFFSDEAGEFKVTEQKVSKGGNFFVLKKSCAGTTVKVTAGNIGACQAKVIAQNYKAGERGTLQTKWEVVGSGVVNEINTLMRLK